VIVESPGEVTLKQEEHFAALQNPGGSYVKEGSVSSTDTLTCRPLAAKSLDCMLSDEAVAIMDS
jgi:hypothetical protein